jgi:lysophospholipase L1-like esterase
MTQILPASPFTLEAADAACLAPADAAGMLAHLPWSRMVVLGDGAAAGVRVPVRGYRDLAFPERVGHALAATRPDFAYRNVARRDAVARDMREHQLDAALELRPDLALVAAGRSDALRADFDPQATRSELRSVLGALLAAGAQPVTAGPFALPYPAPARRLGVVDAILRSVAAEHHAVHVGLDRPHADARGHAVAASAIAEALASVR